MNKSSIHGTGDRREINPDWFTAKTWMKVLSERIESEEQDIYHVHFEDGSKTKLHVHNGPQVLIATAGIGSLEIFERDGAGGGTDSFGIQRTQRIELREGDVVRIPKQALHTHGSENPGETFSHIAINILPGKNAAYETVWYESDFESVVSGIV